jgi:release factor glutamine methyltransferase
VKTIAEIIDLSTRYLDERKAHRAKRSAEELLAHILKLKRVDLYLQYDRPLVESELVDLRALLKRYASGEPLQYVIGELDFLGAKIKVDRRALIPRQETEILADLIAKKVSSGTLWDVCTGSGCIGVSLKKAKPQLKVVLSDISKEALALAKENAQGLDIEILEGDLLAPFEGRKADVIVCNPPYISKKEFQDLDPMVKDYEPQSALLAGESGLEFYEKLSGQIFKFLNPGGMVFFEIGARQGEALKQIFSSQFWKTRELVRDWSGQDRFFFLEMQ